jgi:hypothetical protein
MPKAPSYITNLLRPTDAKQKGRKVWSIDLETVWIPFFTATNAEALTAIPHDALGAPLRLAYEPDGSVRFNDRTGKPVIRVAKDVSDQVKLVRENFTASLQQYAQQVQKSNAEGFKAQAALNVEAGKPIIDRDNEAMQKAIEAQIEAAMSDAQGQPEGARENEPEPEREPATV